MLPRSVWEVPVSEAARLRELFVSLAALKPLRSVKALMHLVYDHGPEQTQQVMLWLASHVGGCDTAH